MAHPSLHQLERLLHGRNNHQKLRGLVQHLARCNRCRHTLAQLRPDGSRVLGGLMEARGAIPLGRRQAGASYEDAFAVAFRRLDEASRRLAQERSQAVELTDELLRQPAERCRILVRNSRRFSSLGLCEALLNAARLAWTDDPERAASLAELAVEVTDQIDPRCHSAAFLNDLKARAWSYVANARRIATQVRQVEPAFDRAEQYLLQGSGDPLEWARFFDLKASFRRDQNRYDDALRLLDRVMNTYRWARERTLAGKALIKQAMIYRRRGQQEQAIAILDQARSLIDKKAEPHLHFCVNINQVNYLAECGRASEARALLPKVRKQALALGGRLDLLRVRWVDGLVAAAQGQTTRAEQALLAARQGFLEAGIVTDVALVSLDLAALYLDSGRSAETRQLAAEIVPLFEAQEVEREALAAVLLFREAAERETLTQAILRNLARRLQQSSQLPEALPFSS